MALLPIIDVFKKINANELMPGIFYLLIARLIISNFQLNGLCEL